MRAIALVDLDDTLFQTLRKCPADVPHGELTAIGFARDGSPLCYATPRQRTLIAWLTETAHFVPVTARGLDALRRVRIPFTHAICAHGGVILDARGEPDPAWTAHIAREAGAHAAALATVAQAVTRGARALGVELSVRVLREGDTGLYVLVKDPDADAARLADCVERIAFAVPAHWTIHRNDNNVAIMPPYLGKEHAVARLLPELQRRYPKAPVIGIGDSLTDAPFMSLCDFAMTPTGSQLAKSFRMAGR
jgi:hypothetical protein